MKKITIGQSVFNGWTVDKLILEYETASVYEISRQEDIGVYRAAMKVIPISKALTAIEEPLILQRLAGCSGIVSYQEHEMIHQSSEEACLLIRMELLTPIFRYDSEIPFTTARLIQLGMDICHGLEVCQANGIFHRNLKPSNIFVTHYGGFKLGGFGLSTFASHYIPQNEGAANFMAPEVYFKENFFYCSDVYSLALSLYYFLNNEAMPFWPSPEPTEQEARAALEFRMNKSAIPRPVYGSDKLWAIIKKGCEYNPRDRFATARGFKSALLSCLQNEDDITKILTLG